MAINCNTIVISGLLFVLGGRCWAQGADTAVMRRLLIEHFDGVAQKDFVKLKSVVTDDYHIYEDGKIWTADSVFKNIQFHQPFSVTFTLSDFDFFVDTRSGFARYREQAQFVMRDTLHFTLEFISSAMFRKTAKGWKIAMIHLTHAEPPVVGMPSLYEKFDSLRYIPDHYRERVEQFSREAVKKGEIVFFGNSITEFGHWTTLLGDSGAVNRGIAGDNTFGMLHRLDAVIALKPAKLFIEAGINDIGQGVPIGMIAGNITSIVEYVRVKSPGTKVFVVSVLPTNENAQKDYPEVAGKNAVTRELNQRLQEQAGSYGFVFIDLAGRIKDEAGNLGARYARGDGLHLNAEGYQVFVRLLREKGFL
jgi:lysophospholipase L1-like esterase